MPFILSLIFPKKFPPGYVIELNNNEKEELIKILIGTTIAIIDTFTKLRKLAEIGDLRKLSREELEFYDEDIKNMRDIYATRKFDEKRLPGGSCIPRVAFSVLYSPLASHLAKKRSLTK